MEKYRYSDGELKLLESSLVPFAIYQFIDKRVVTIVLSEGFSELFGYGDMDKKELYDLMDNNMYRDTHPDDMSSLGDAGCERIRKSGKTPVILFTDFDGMKVYNQRYGLEEGDRILKSFSEDIIDLFTHENCSRFNADHFCIFTDEEKAYQAVEKMFEKNSRLESEKKMPLRIGMYRYEDQNISISGACDRCNAH